MEVILASARPEVVFHLASLFLSEHRPDDIEGLVASNILLSTQLAEAMLLAGTSRLVNTGTSWQHWGGDGYRPVNLYAATKQAFEDVLAYYHDARGLSCTTLKLFDTYGPRDPRGKLIAVLMEAARSGRVLELSPGEQILDLLHVEDVVEAFRLAAERLLDAPEPLLDSFLLSGSRVTLRELVEFIGRVTGRPVPAKWGGRPYRNREVMDPVVSGEPLPGWKQKVDLVWGLTEVFRALEPLP
jgi:nucleoside-diphosphate-sugar epimerase